MRAISLDEVDEDLSELAKRSSKKSGGVGLERTPEDDEAIAEAIGDVEYELKRDSSWTDIINLLVVMVAVLGAMFYMQTLS